MPALRRLLVVVGIAGTILIGAAVERGSHSVSDTLYGAIGPVLLLWLIIGLALVLLRRRQA
jgi:hypothetical protein